MTNPYRASVVQSLPAATGHRLLSAVAVATVTFGCLLLIIFLKRGQLRPADAGNILIFILPVYLALGWYVMPSKKFYVPTLVVIAAISWATLWILSPVVVFVNGGTSVFVHNVLAVVLVNLSLAIAASAFQVFANRFKAYSREKAS